MPREASQIEELFEKHKGEDHTIQFVSYNYTDVLDKIIARIADPPFEVWNNNGQEHKYAVLPNVIHAHGTLDSFTIFGVNDRYQIANRELLSVENFAEIMIKPTCVKALNETWHKETIEAIKNSTVICIFGMSLGSTDSLWYKTIMKWLKEDENRHLIVFLEKSQKPDKTSCAQYFNNNTEIRKKMDNYADGTNEELNKMHSRIHVIVKTERVLRVKLKPKKKEIQKKMEEEKAI